MNEDGRMKRQQAFCSFANTPKNYEGLILQVI